MTLFHAITSTILFFVSSHLKIAIFRADWFDGNGYGTHLLVLSSINERSSWIYRLIQGQIYLL